MGKGGRALSLRAPQNGAPASAPYLPAPPSSCLPARPPARPARPALPGRWLPPQERRSNSFEFFRGYGRSISKTSEVIFLKP